MLNADWQDIDKAFSSMGRAIGICLCCASLPKKQIDMESENKKQNEAQSSTVGASEKKRVVNQFDSVLGKARVTFARQLVKTSEMKRMAITDALSRIKDLAYTAEHFKLEYAMRVRRMLDSIYFREECKSKMLDTFNTATHIVFYGQILSRLVLENGIDAFREHNNEIDGSVYTKDELKTAGDRLLIRYIEEESAD